MSGTLSLSHLWTALAVAAALAGLVTADEPEPPFSDKDEPAAPSVHLDKAKDNNKLAQQAKRDEKASKKNLTTIGLGVHSYFDAKNALPDDVKDKNGKALLSW